MNLYTVIGMACVDEDFRKALFDDHVSALQARGISLAYGWEADQLKSWTLAKDRGQVEKIFSDFHHSFCPIKPCPPGWPFRGKKKGRK